MIKLALRNIWRSPLRSSIIIIAMIIGVSGSTIGFGILYGMSQQRLLNGVETEVGHIEISQKDSIGNYKAFDKKNVLNQINHIILEQSINWCQQMSFEGTLSSSRAMMPIRILAVDSNLQKVNKLHEFIIAGNALPFTKKGILIGEALAKKLKIKNNSKVTLQLPDNKGELISVSLRVRGIFKTSNALFETSQILVSLEWLQKQISFKREDTHILSLSIDQKKSLSVQQALIQKKIPNYSVETWKDLKPEYAIVNTLMNFLTFVLLLILFSALGLGILNVMRMAVLERTKEFGILRSIGMTNKKVFNLIFLETLFLSLIGSGFGLLVGVITVKIFNHTGIDLRHIADGLEAVGYNPIVYPRLNLSALIKLPFFVFFTSLLASILASKQALKNTPAEVIRT